MIRISIDAMGGDNGLATTIPGALIALKKHKTLSLTLVGDEHKINNELNKHNHKSFSNRISVHHTTEVVLMDESPSVALRKKKDSSMRVAINLVKLGTVSACVSAGNTGALMASSKFVLKTLPSIDRPAIIYGMPTRNDSGVIKTTYMLDLGANVNCSSEQLFQFGVMGSVMSNLLHNIEKPKVALLNIGEEEMKGLDYIKQAAEMLKNSEDINYIGYVEGNDISKDKADVIVCDGFTGNIALKVSEGVAGMISKTIKDSTKGFFGKILAFFAIPLLLIIKSKINVDKYNGASLVGLRGIVVKSHGSVTPESYAIAISEAVKEVHFDIPNKISNLVESIIEKKSNIN